MGKLLIALLLVLVPSTLQAGPPKWVVNLTCGAAATTGFTEIVFTESCVQRGTCEERNVFLPKGKDRKSTLGRATIKGIGTAGAIRIAYIPKNTWMRFGICAGLTAGNVYLAKRGWDLLDDRKR